MNVFSLTLAFLSFWPCLDYLLASPFELPGVLISGGVCLGSVALSFFYYVLKHDARGSTGIPLYEKDGTPVGSLGFYYGLKKKLGIV